MSGATNDWGRGPSADTPLRPSLGGAPPPPGSSAGGDFKGGQATLCTAACAVLERVCSVWVCWGSAAHPVRLA